MVSEGRSVPEAAEKAPEKNEAKISPVNEESKDMAQADRKTVRAFLRTFVGAGFRQRQRAGVREH